MAPIPARPALTAIAALASLLAMALTAGPASARTGRPSLADSLRALARNQWLRAVQAKNVGPAAAARAGATVTGIDAALTH